MVAMDTPLFPAEWRDITQCFEFLEDKLVYVDAPLEGFLRSARGDVFAFRCRELASEDAWEWVLVLTQGTASTVAEIFRVAKKHAPTTWLTIRESRAPKQCLSASMRTSVDSLPDRCTSSDAVG